MATVLLVRHGLTALTGPVLAGWTPGVHLDGTGRAQAERLAERLRPVPFRDVVTSPLERCQETAAALTRGRSVPLAVDDRLGECRYGEWTGRPLAELAQDPLWQVVQLHPSAAVFPGADGEGMAEAAARAVAAVRETDARVSATYGAEAVWLAVSHSDVIKAVVADALGLHLDLFQRLVVDPCSVTVIRYTQTRPFLLRLNDVGDVSAGLVTGTEGSDAVVGGGAGNGAIVGGGAGNGR